MVQPASNGHPKETVSGTAVTVLAFLAAVYLPVVGLICLLALPGIVFYYRAKLGRGNGLIVPGVTGAVMLLVFGGLTPDLLIVSSLLLLGFVLSELAEQRLTIEETIGYACGIVFVSGLLGVLLYGNLTGTALVPLISAYIAKNLELSLMVYRDMGMPAERVEAVSASLDTIRFILVRLLPALYAAGILIVAWMTVLLVRRLMRQQELGFPDFGHLNQWQAPDILVWGVIGSGLLLLLPATALKIVGGNVLIVLATIYFFQGMAIASFYFERKSLPTILKIFLYGLVFVWQPLLIGVVGLGLFDMWGDFRRLKNLEADDRDGEEEEENDGGIF